MKAALVQADGSMKVSEVPTPEAAPGSVVVKVAFCGICGSDIHMLDAGLFPAGCIIGHEMSGFIADVGQGVEGWQEEDPVAVMPLAPCFSCEPCKRGDVQICQEGLTRSYGLGMNPGGFAQFISVSPSALFRIPNGLEPRGAALNEPWSVAVHGVNLSGFRIGEPAAVLGGGPIGLLCMFALRAAGASQVFVSEPDPFRAERARATGADLVVDPSKEFPADRFQEHAGKAPKFVFDCAGTETSTDEAAAIAGPYGRVVLLGVPMGNASLFPLRWFMRELQLLFSFGYTYAEFGGCLQVLARGAVEVDNVVSDVMPLAEVDHAFKLLHGSGHTKILIDCQAV